MKNLTTALALASFLAITIISTHAQAPNRRQGNQPPRVTSPEVSSDRKITFRILAPKAETVKLTGGDIPGQPQGGAVFTKDTDGVWEATLGPVPAGAYRYQFNVDGLPVVDPRNPATSESNNNVWSLVIVPGSDDFDVRNVPHGVVSEVTYHSSTLNRPRRMHVYTPPGYEKGEGKYPVFYLLHGASDSDNSWSSVGRAGFILDNLIADKKAKPMLVVMPAGHTAPFNWGGRFSDDFEKDFIYDVMPYIEKTYRVQTDRQSRAIAGLSMGGAQTLNIAFQDLAKFAYVGVFSSGIFGITGDRPNPNNEPSWEERHKQTLADTKLKDGLKLFWFGTGKDDFLLRTSQATVEMFKKHNFDVKYDETQGGHTWLVWRDYLKDFAPRLFQ